jgi:hypothetical protein
VGLPSVIQKQNEGSERRNEDEKIMAEKESRNKRKEK